MSEFDDLVGSTLRKAGVQVERDVPLRAIFKICKCPECQRERMEGAEFSPGDNPVVTETPGKAARAHEH